MVIFWKKTRELHFWFPLFLVHLSQLRLVCFWRRSYDTPADNTDKASIDLVDIKGAVSKIEFGDPCHSVFELIYLGIEQRLKNENIHISLFNYTTTRSKIINSNNLSAPNWHFPKHWVLLQISVQGASVKDAWSGGELLNDVSGVVKNIGSFATFF